MTDPNFPSLPARALRTKEAWRREDTHDLYMYPTVDEVYIIALIRDEQVQAVLYDEDVEMWEEIASVPASADTEARRAFEREYTKWTEFRYPHLVERGELVPVNSEDIPEEYRSKLPWSNE